MLAQGPLTLIQGPFTSTQGLTPWAPTAAAVGVLVLGTLYPPSLAS